MVSQADSGNKSDRVTSVWGSWQSVSIEVILSEVWKGGCVPGSLPRRIRELPRRTGTLSRAGCPQTASRWNSAYGPMNIWLSSKLWPILHSSNRKEQRFLVVRCCAHGWDPTNTEDVSSACGPKLRARGSKWWQSGITKLAVQFSQGSN